MPVAPGARQQHAEKLTGVPLLINTRYTMHEESIAYTPEDGARSLLDPQLESLAVGPFIASRVGAESPLVTGSPGNERSQVEARR